MKIKLTDTQKIAVEFAEKDLLVSAGAGSGKTAVLVERFVHFVKRGRAKVTEILALTFTEKAANEMKSRIMKEFQKEKMQQARRDLELAYISTLHAFAARLLKEHPIEAGIHPDFSVIEPEQAELLQDQALDEVIEKNCVRASGVFELLRIYGEEEIRKGIKKALTTARIEGLGLKEFFDSEIASSASGLLAMTKDTVPFAPSLRGSEATEAISVFLKLGEPQLAADWQRFAAQPEWDWKTLESFREWSENFNRRGGKKNKEEWRQAAEVCKKLAGLHLDRLALPWRARFEEIALPFEAAYEAKKFEHGVLDFDDLQKKALEMLRADRPGSRKLLEHYRKQFQFVLVDEFQDVNALQVQLIECFRPQGRSFFVGDSKQSIYGFRGTSPVHFFDKERLFQKGEAGVLVAMLENFRTELPVLHFINTLFEKIWAEDGVEYSGLVAQAEEKAGRTPELWVVRKEKDETTEEARLREAAALAKRIADLHAEGIPYGDMAVLFEVMSHAGIYEHALKAAGVPYFSVSGRGFYHQPEVRDMISLLSVIENPLLDIPLAAALRSPFFHVSDDALFWLAHSAKKEDEDQPLYGGLKILDAIPEIAAEEKEKLAAFRNFLEAMVRIKDSLRLSELLERILRQTSYDLSVLADRQGVRRYANLKKLIHLAREEEAREKISLGDFIRLVRGFEAREIRESEAQVEAEESRRVVRLMTVHAAKGLEFPVCFVADLGNRSQNSESRTFVAEAGQGYGFKIRNEETLEMEKPLAYERVQEIIAQRETDEWKRLFYVALTRAKSRLILSGVYSPPTSSREKFSEMSTWMEWMMAVAADMPLEIHEVKEGVVLSSLNAPPVFAEEFFQKVPGTAEGARHLLKVPAVPGTFGEPPARVLDLPVSAYCAFAKNPLDYWRIYEMGYPDSREEHEMERAVAPEENEEDAADFGTKIHKVFELLDFKNPEPQLGRILSEIFYGEEASRLAEARRLVLDFIKGGTFQRLRSAKKIYRELRFVLNERHGRIDGVIDVLFQDRGGAWHLLDYKTAVGGEAKVREAAYDLQIGIYAAAVSEILGVIPQTGFLAFLKNSWTHPIPVSAAFLQQQTERVRQLQEEILDYRNAKTGV